LVPDRELGQHIAEQIPRLAVEVTQCGRLDRASFEQRDSLKLRRYLARERVFQKLGSGLSEDQP
jgi:hypothetical protein